MVKRIPKALETIHIAAIEFHNDFEFGIRFYYAFEKYNHQLYTQEFGIDIIFSQVMTDLSHLENSVPLGLKSLWIR